MKKRTPSFSKQVLAKVVRSNPEAVTLSALDDGRYIEVNEGFTRLMGYTCEEVVGKSDAELGHWARPRERREFIRRLRADGHVRGMACEFRTRSGEIKVGLMSAELVELKGKPSVLAVTSDITEQKRTEAALREALKESERRQAEVTGLLQGARSLLEHRDFLAVAQSLFHACKELTGATAGYIALLTKDGRENEVVFLDPGGLTCTVDPNRPMPIRGFRADAQRAGKAIYDNAFAQSPWVKYLPEGHSRVENVLFAPMVGEGKALGLVGLSNKPGGFEENDARLAAAFAELASIGFLKGRALASLERSEERFRSVVETASDAIITIDGEGRVTFWNRGAEDLFGFSPQEVMGRPLTTIMPERFRDRHEAGFRRFLATGVSEVMEGAVELSGLRKGGNEFPMEFSVTRWSIQGETHFTGIVRDITERKRAEQALQRAHDELEQRVVQRTSELLLVNRTLEEEIVERRRVADALWESEQQLRRLSSELLASEERERKRIAHELHDSIGQSLSAIKFSIENALQEMEAGVPASRRAQLEAIVSMIQVAMEEVRKITMDLRPSILDDLGIVATIGWFCREYQRVYGSIRVEQAIDIAEEEVPEPLKIVVFRILQEAMNNVAKHSKADRVRLSLQKEDGGIVLSIQDNGMGMSVVGGVSSGGGLHGLGLASMRERAELSGGSFSTASDSGQGTRVVARWPAES